MTGRQEARDRLISMLMVAGFVLSLFAGMTPVVSAQGPAGGSITGTGDLYIGNNQVFTVDSIHYMDGNVTVDGGTLRIINGSLEFLQDAEHVYRMQVMNNGKVIMENGSITVHLDRIHPYPYLTLSVDGSEFVMSGNSSLAFPGWLNVTGSYFNMTDSEITSIDNGTVDEFVGDHVNTADGDNANDCPIMNFHDSGVYIYDSEISHLFEYRRGDAAFHTSNFNMTLSGDTEFTAVNSYISIDLSNSSNSFSSANNAHIKNFLVMEGSANAYLYGLSIDASQTPPSSQKDSSFGLVGTGTVYLFRWANYTVLDSNRLPVPGATLESLEVSTGSDPVHYPSSHGDLSIPPEEVLTYMGKTSANYNVTDSRGEAIIPYLTDIVLPDSKPNSDFLGNYRTYANYSDGGTDYSVNRNFSFQPYPSFNGTVSQSMTISDLTLPLPELFPSALVTDPAQVFEGDNVTLTATIENTGGSNAVDVCVSFYDANKSIGERVLPIIGHGMSRTVSIVWNNTMTKVGVHQINVTVDPNNFIVEEEEGNNTLSMYINVTPRLPDLEIEASDITVTPVSPYVGNEFTVSATVHNVGDVPAKVTVEIYNGTETKAMGANATNPISSGGDYTVNFTVKFDAPGSYNLRVEIDPENFVGEYFEDNNSATISVNVVGKPDLSIGPGDIYFSDPYPDEGQSVTMYATVHNTGASDVYSDFDICFYLDDASSSPIGIYSYDASTSGNIPPGGSIVASIPWVAEPWGEHTVIVRVNHGDVDESSSMNNETQAHIVVMRTDDSDLIVNDTHYPHLTLDYDYSLSGYILVEEHGVMELDSSKLTILQQKAGEFSIVVRDHGSLSLKDSSISSKYGLNIILEGSSSLILQNSTLSSGLTVIAHNSSTIYVEDGTLNGKVAFPDSDSHVVMEAYNTTFSSGMGDVCGGTLLYLVNVDTGSLELSDQSVARVYEWLTVNTYDGTMHPLAGVDVGSYFPINRTFWRGSLSDANGACIIPLITDTLDADHQQVVGGYLVNGSYIFHGTTYFSDDFHVTVDNYPDSVNKNLPPSQYRSLDIVFQALKPDLDPPVYVSSSSLVYDVAGLDMTYVNTTVWNNGTADAHDILVEFYNDGAVIGGVTIDELDVGESYDCSIIWHAEKPLGQHNISVVVDPYNSIPELDETNNGGWTMVEVIGWADLQPVGISFSPSEVVRGRNTTITAAIHNYGDNASAETQFSFYDGNPLSGGTLIGTVNINTIPAGGEGYASLNWGPASSGDHSIYAVVDPAAALQEKNEDNNVLHTDLYVEDYPDLLVVIDFSSNELVEGHTVYVNVTTYNLGESAAFDVHVQLFDGDGNLLRNRTIPELEAYGENSTISYLWTAPQTGVYSTYTFRALVDSENTTVETDESNNEAVASLGVNIPDIELHVSDIMFNYQSSDVYDGVVAGQGVNIDVVVENSGNDSAHNVLVELYDITGQPVMVGASGQSIPTLAGGSSTTVSFTWTAPPVETGHAMIHTFRAVVDAPNDIPEEDESNNDYSRTLTVWDWRPDISFSGDVILNYTAENLTGGDDVLVLFTLVNEGVRNATVDVTINATLSNGTSYTIGLMTGLNISANGSLEANYTWTVDLPAETYFITAIADPQNEINETYEDNNIADNASLTIVPPVPAFGNGPIVSAGLEYNAGAVVVVTGTVVNQLNGAPLGGVTVTVNLLDADGIAVTDAGGNPVTASSVTGDDGGYTITLMLPNNMKTGDYSLAVSAAGVSQSRAISNLQVQGAAAGLSWIYILLAIVIIAFTVGPMLYFKFFGKLGEMVECGACGALIPAGSSKCPKCGVEFETETAKCSVCGAWVPIDSSTCPECGAVFAPMTEEEEYQQKMHEEYEEEVLNPLKEMAKAELGNDYDDEKFMEWATAQEEFIAFEDWLQKREEERAKMIECPTCGTLNPADAIVCQTCGSDLRSEEEKPKKVKKKVKKAKPPEGGEAASEGAEEKKEEPGVALGLDDVLGTKPAEKKPESAPAPRKVMKPVKAEEKPSTPEEKAAAPPAEAAPEAPKAPAAGQPVRKVVRKPVQKRVVKRPVQTEEKKE